MTGADRIDELFPRYWDGSLTAAETEELTSALRGDRACRIRFHQLCADAVVIGERFATSPRPAPIRSRRRWYAAAGIFAIAASLLIVLWAPARPPGPVLASSVGMVSTGNDENDRPARPGARVAAGETIRTHGPGASAVLAYPDGSTIHLTGDTTATLDRAGSGWLVVHHGSVLANACGGEVTLTTPETSAVFGGHTKVALGRTPGRTEVGVWGGHARVTDTGSGGPMDVAGGELATVSAGGIEKHLLPTPPDEFAWDLTHALPTGWEVGRREEEIGSPFVRAQFWNDRYLRRHTFQIRSDDGWTRGFCLLHPDSVIHARYRVDRPGPGQFLVVVRPDPPVGGITQVLELSGPFRLARPGIWETFQVRVADLKQNKKLGLDFGPPWVAARIIFNTFEANIGLSVSEFRVTRPPR